MDFTYHGIEPGALEANDETTEEAVPQESELQHEVQDRRPNQEGEAAPRESSAPVSGKRLVHREVSPGVWIDRME
jgi:hypothetical protein